MLAPLSDADLKLLRVFHTIVVSGGITPAQPELNASQSTISTQLSQLETRLGFRLCRRGRSGFALTERGKVVFDEAQLLFSAINDFRSRVSDSSETMEGELRIGVIDNIISHDGLRINEVIGSFKNDYPKARISIHVEPVINLEQMILDNRIHAAISFCHHKLETLSYHEFQDENHFLYCGAGNRLFDWDDSAPHTIDEIEAASYVSRSYLESGLPTLNINFKADAHADNIEALAILILTGRYVAFLPEHYASRWVSAGAMRAIMPEHICQTARFSLILPKVGRPSRIADAFIATFRKAHGDAFAS